MARKVLVIVAFFVAFLAASRTASAQNGFLWGYIVGQSSATKTSEPTATTMDSSVVYRIDPKLVKDPLKVMFATKMLKTSGSSAGVKSMYVMGWPLWNIFDVMVVSGKGKDYCVVEIKITPRSGDEEYRNFDFLYTEWSNIISAAPPKTPALEK